MKERQTTCKLIVSENQPPPCNILLKIMSGLATVADAAGTSLPESSPHTPTVLFSNSLANDKTTTTSLATLNSGVEAACDVVDTTTTADAESCKKTAWSKAMSKEEEAKWISQFTREDVEAEGRNLKKIGGVDIKPIRIHSLYEFCRRNNITGFKQLKKDKLCETIARRSKAVDDVNDDPSNAIDKKNSGFKQLNKVKLQETIALRSKAVDDVYDDPSNANESKNSASDGNRMPKKDKSTTPNKVKTDGTLYRAINVFFSKKHRDDVTSLGQPPTRQQLNSPNWLHHDVFERLVQTYNNIDEPNGSIDDLQVKDRMFRYCDPSKFDTIDAVDFKEIMDFLVYHYKEACNKKTKRDKHGSFSRACGYKVFLYYFYCMLAYEHGKLIDIVDTDLGDSFEEGGIDDNSSCASRSEATDYSSKKRSASSMAVRENGKSRSQREFFEFCKAYEESNKRAKERNKISLRIAKAFEVRFAVNSANDDLVPERWKQLDENLTRALANLHTLKEIGYSSSDPVVREMKQVVKMWMDQMEAYRLALKRRLTSRVAANGTPGVARLPSFISLDNNFSDDVEGSCG